MTFLQFGHSRLASRCAVISKTLDAMSVSYTHLDVYKRQVLNWAGDLQMREAQSFAWQQLPVTVKPVLPGAVPVLQWLAEDQGFMDATHCAA